MDSICDPTVKVVWGRREPRPWSAVPVCCFWLCHLLAVWPEEEHFSAFVSFVKGVTLIRLVWGLSKRKHANRFLLVTQQPWSLSCSLKRSAFPVSEYRVCIEIFTLRGQISIYLMLCYQTLMLGWPAVDVEVGATVTLFYWWDFRRL